MELYKQLEQDILKYIPHPCTALMRDEIEEFLWDCWFEDYHNLSHGEYLTRMEKEKMRGILVSMLRSKLEEADNSHTRTPMPTCPAE